MSERDELIEVVLPVLEKCFDSDWNMTYSEMVTDALITAGYRKIFDGDCGLSNVKDPTDREASEAWMRWANLVSGEDPDGIAAMRQMLTEFGYRKPRIITTAEELDALGRGATVMDPAQDVWTNDGDTLDQWGSVTAAEPYGGPQWFGSADIALPVTVLHDPEVTL